MTTYDLFSTLLKLGIVDDSNWVFEQYDMIGFHICLEYEQIRKGEFEGDIRICDGWKVDKVQDTLN